VLAELTRYQEVSSDRKLLAWSVPGQLDHLHAVEQGTGDRALLVGRRNEHHFAEVEWRVDVVVGELMVLFWVEHFEQGTRWIPALVAAELVDFVEDHHRVLGAGLLQPGDDASGERADIGSAVPKHLGFIGHAA